jgi:hypothetical protein
MGLLLKMMEFLLRIVDSMNFFFGKKNLHIGLVTKKDTQILG